MTAGLPVPNVGLEMMMILGRGREVTVYIEFSQSTWPAREWFHMVTKTLISSRRPQGSIFA